VKLPDLKAPTLVSQHPEFFFGGGGRHWQSGDRGFRSPIMIVMIIVLDDHNINTYPSKILIKMNALQNLLKIIFLWRNGDNDEEFCLSLTEELSWTVCYVSATREITFVFFFLQETTYIS
jgi:hypothetical protein